ncbi:30S ribosomal protein S16 [Mesomycoplasma lagogenitalium]|uniref:Small ribosomal subunit protein bS16 n=1 Tax=Mesomycoplasma lagogenitalium TaxID=171286 RepID=A0ABY8LUI8_9BACT|nr:30S ribosomal protein S16 [Mesomycoplasma lagogenitalium]WGI36909.1 30S ribosomal protein S16 [Mesomycoplasma lagogenitalium]
MVKIRLKRLGSKFNPVYKVVAADARAPRDGRFIEVLGHYNPRSKELKLEKELVLKWLNIGAKPTDTVRNLLKKEAIIKEFASSKNN